MISWTGTVLAVAVIGLACIPTDGCGCPPIPPFAAVFGRVQTAAGAPVAQATVSAYIAREGDCGRHESPDGTAVTRGDGSYTVGIAGPEPTEATCVRVQVRAPLESGLLDAADTMVAQGGVDGCGIWRGQLSSFQSVFAATRHVQTNRASGSVSRR